MDYSDRLRMLAMHDTRLVDGGTAGPAAMPEVMDQKSLGLVRLAALIAVGGELPSYSALVDAAIGSGATTAEVVDVLCGVVDIVGLAGVVAAAPRLAVALGCDTDDDMELLVEPRPRPASLRPGSAR